MLLLPGALSAQSDIPWGEAGSPARLVFTRPHEENFCLLSAPARIDGGVISGGKARFGGSVRPVRLVWGDATNAFFLVDCRGLAEQQEAVLYLLTNSVPASTNVVDPRPVRFYAQRTAGQDMPATWEQLQLLDTRVDREPFYQALADFEADDDTPSGWYRGDWQRKNTLFRFSCWMLFPAAGRYVFGLRTDQPTWLSVDDDLVLEHRSSRRAGWVTAPPRVIAAGLHRVVARGVTRQDLHLAAGWSLEGHKDAPGVIPITGGELACARLERRDRRLHALAVATVGYPYVFEGTTNVFVPVRLESRSVSWDGAPVSCTWRRNGRELGAGRVCKTVLDAAAGAGRIELTAIDNRGNTARDEVPVTPERLARNVYRVSGRLVGVPAIGYGEDPVRPELHVRASSPDDIDFTVEAVIERAGGGTTNLSALVDIVRSWGRFVLPVGTADAFRRIDWRVLHGGVVLDRGATVFEHAPFRTLPDTLDGDMLCARTHTLMLVPRRASAGASPAFEGLRRGQRLLLLDGFLAADAVDTNLPARLDESLARDVSETAGASPASYRRVNLRALEASGSGDGVARLLPLAQLGALLPADVVVVAPPFDALGQGETPAQFERRLAALAGLLAGPGHASVALVTPPPFAILPGCEGLAATGVPPPDARQMAELITRVADANGLPVVDLYTACMTARECAPHTRNGSLTPAGMEQAVEALRRVLYGASMKGK